MDKEDSSNEIGFEEIDPEEEKEFEFPFYWVIPTFMAFCLFFGVLYNYVCSENEIISFKQYLFETNSAFTIDDSEKYDKKINTGSLSSMIDYPQNRLLILYHSDYQEELILKNEWQKLKKGKYFISTGYREINVLKHYLKSTKKEDSMSTGEWILLIIVMLGVAKVAHLITLKTVFKPAKKALKHVEKEWGDS